MILCIYAEMLPMDFSSAFSMSCLLIVFHVIVSLLLVVKRGIMWIRDYAKAKPPKVPWIYGRPYLFRGRFYTYERPRKPRAFAPHSGSTLQELEAVEHHRRMRELLRARKLVHKSYRITTSRERRRKRSHRAHPRLFIGRPRGKPAEYDISLKLTQPNVPWDMSPEKSSYSQRFRDLYLSFLIYWRKRLHPESVYADHRIKKFRECFYGVPRCGMFHSTPKRPSNGDDDPNNPLFVLSAPNGLLQPLRRVTQESQIPTYFPLICFTLSSLSLSPY